MKIYKNIEQALNSKNRKGKTIYIKRKDITHKSKFNFKGSVIKVIK